ncbi:MAG: lanthionine synthetase LanC family protein [Thermoanaerobaculia bacterium]
MDSVARALEQRVNITEPFVLREDVQLVPCAELSDDVRARISYEEGDFTLSRRHGRTLAQVIDADTAALLALFRRPRTIVDAVLENSRALSKDPEAWLDELLPHLGAFVQSRVLVEAASEAEQELRPRYDSGAEIGEWKVVRCASLIEDSEIYQLRSGVRVAALKIARVTTPHWEAVLANETCVLRHLDGAGIAPRLIEHGVHDDRAYFISDWIAGVDAGVAAAQRRHDRASLIDLCATIASRYAALHASGVLHADVHPRNILVGDDVTLLDFGYSRILGEPARVGRGGIAYFSEPEYVSARRQGRGLPASAEGEQYALAALLYLLLTGKHYLDFRYDREEMDRQIETDAPLPFASRGIPPWPEVEQILFRALEKDPARRHASVADMAALLANVRDATLRESLATPLSAEAQALLETTLQSFARDGEMFANGYPAPKASITFGGAGAAVGLLRIAETRGDAELLALADVWRSRAVKLGAKDDAYYDSYALTRQQLGDVSPFHTESGVHAAAATIAAAMGDSRSQRHAIEAFLRASSHPCAELDLTLGRSGSLLAAAMLLPIGDELPVAASLRRFGTETMTAIWNELDARPPIDASPQGTYLGVAHGWAGYLYAALRWCTASGDPPPPRLLERLHELAAMKTLRGRGVYWRTAVDKPLSSSMAGWCHGSAGHLFLYTLAHRVFGDDEWLRLAELCAWDNWDSPRSGSTLCCGTAGRAYSLLHLYKHTGATEWLSRARQLANHAASDPNGASSLWKGSLGVAVLIADLASPENARMPFFE